MAMKISSTSFRLKEGVTLLGRSRAGDGTSFVIPELKWVFDCGALVHQAPPQHIFLTHTHADHVTFLANFLNNTHPPNLYLPAEALPFVEAYLKAHVAMTEMSNDIPPLEDFIKLCPVTPGKEFRIKKGNEYAIVPIAAHHRITCYGYSIFRLKNLRKEEFSHLKGREIAQLKKEGVELFEQVREPLLCYIGDSTHEVFEQNPDILRQHSYILTECSFIGQKLVAQAQKTKHTHWQNLQPIIEAHPRTLFILNHFSLRNSALTLREFFRKHTAHLGNVHPMLLEEEMRTEWDGRRSGGKLPSCNCFGCNNPEDMRDGESTKRPSNPKKNKGKNK